MDGNGNDSLDTGVGRRGGQPASRWRTDSSPDAARPCATLPAPVLLCVDGFAAYVAAFLAITRTPDATTGQHGRPRLRAWAGVVIGQVVKHREGYRVVAVTRRLVQGTEAALARLLPTSNSAFALPHMFPLSVSRVIPRHRSHPIRSVR